MAINVVSSGEAKTATGVAATSLSVSLPALGMGQMYLIAVSWFDLAADSTQCAVSGSTEIYESYGGSASERYHHALFYKTTTGSVTVTLDVASPIVVQWAVVDEVLLGTPVAVIGTLFSSASTNGFTLTGPAFTGRGLAFVLWAIDLDETFNAVSGWSVLQQDSASVAYPDAVRSGLFVANAAGSTPAPNFVATTGALYPMTARMVVLQERPPNVPRTAFIGIF